MISYLCNCCGHLHPFKKGRRNTRLYSCDAFPDLIPEGFHKEFTGEPIYLDENFSPIQCNNGIFWEPKNPIASEMPKTLGIVLRRINKNLSKKDIEQLLVNPYENKKNIIIDPHQQQERILQIQYEWSAPEVKILLNVVNRIENGLTLSEKIINQISKYGFGFISAFSGIRTPPELILHSCSPEEIFELNNIIMEPNKKTAQNIILLNYRLATYVSQQMGWNNWMVKRDSFRDEMICSFLLHHFRKYVNFQYQINRCILCGTKFHSGSGNYCCSLKHGEDVLQKIFPGFKTTNDIKICSSCFSFNSPIFMEKKSQMTILNDIKELYELLGFVPPSDFRSYSFLSRIETSRENFIKIFKKIHEMYPYSATNANLGDPITKDPITYKTIFGDWLNCLKEAGLLDENGVKSYYGYRCKAIDGHTCHSLAERMIDDFFYQNHIPHEREPYYPFDNELNKNEMLRADWKIKENTFVEFFGLVGKEGYDKKTESKIEILKKNEIPAIFLYPRDEYQLSVKFKKFMSN